MPRLPRFLRTLFRKDRLERELGDELSSYLEHLAAEKQAAGLDPDAARRAALMEVGGMEQVKEHVRDARPGALLDQLAQDARHGLRGLTRHPRFGAAIVLTLGLATGATTALFGIVDAVLLRSLPYREAERLVMLYEGLPGVPGLGKIGFSAPDYTGFRERATSYEAVAAFRNKSYELSGVDAPERLTGARISAELFGLLGVTPALGRDFSPEDDRGARPLVLLSDALWARTFARDPGVVGRSIVLDRASYTIVGVMPRGFVFPSRGPVDNDRPADVYVPMSFTSEELEAFGAMYNQSVVARLKPDVPPTVAAAEAKTLASQIVRELYPAEFKPKLAIHVRPFRDEVVGRVRTLLFGLFAAIAIVLLIACVDVANLILTRAVGRERELAVRAVLGASRGRLARQLLVETVVLALLGGALGVVLARVGLALFVAWAPTSLPRAQEIGVDARVLAFALLLSLLTGLVAGALPAWEAGRRAPVDAIKEAGRGGGRNSRQRRMLAALVSIQFALSAVLLVGGGLIVRSLQRLLATEPGFRPERVVTMALSLPASGYPDAPSIRTFYEALLERTASLPGVRAASLSTFLPLGVQERRAFSIESPPAASVGLAHVVAQDWVAGRYAEAMGIVLRRGRFLDERDRQGSEPVAVINETMARQFWASEDPLDSRIKWGGPTSTAPWMRIVGIVGDVKQGPLSQHTVAQTWTPWRQVSDPNLADNVVGMLRSLRLSLRGDVEPLALVASVRAEVRRLDSALPLTDVRTLEDVLRASTSPQRWNGWLFGAFAVVALLLAAVGVGGVLAESVSRRTHELGVRLVLGADRADVLRLVLREGLAIAGIGVLIGLPSALALTRLLSSLLFEVSPRDPLTFGAVVVVLGGVALVACALPALRATRVDPAAALRHD